MITVQYTATQKLRYLEYKDENDLLDAADDVDRVYMEEVLPEKMKMLRFRSYNDYDEEILEAGDHYVSAKLNEVLVFIRPGRKLELAKPACCMRDIDMEHLNTISF